MNISSPSSWSRGVFVVDEQENIINRVPAYERLVTGKKRSNPHEVTNLMKNTGSHNGYLRLTHEANGGKKLWQTMKIKVNSIISTTLRNPRDGWMSARSSIQTITETSALIASVSRNIAAASVLLASATYATWIV